MTDNKPKRGRPPGTGKKKEVVGPFNPDNLQAEVMAVYDAPKIDTMADEHPMYEKVFPKSDAEVKQDAAEKNRRENEKYPANWNELGKVQKLEWLTAHPRK